MEPRTQGPGASENAREMGRGEAKFPDPQHLQGTRQNRGDSHPLLSFLRETARSPRLHFLLVPSPQGVLRRQALTVGLTFSDAPAGEGSLHKQENRSRLDIWKNFPDRQSMGKGSMWYPC